MNEQMVILYVLVVGVVLIGSLLREKRAKTERERAFMEGWCAAVDNLRSHPMIVCEVLGGEHMTLGNRQQDASMMERGGMDGAHAQDGMEVDCGRGVESQGVQQAPEQERQRMQADDRGCGARAGERNG